ncbi:MAG TPA: CRTAC1 family protein, partial [Polyangiaceae bacterium]|nr:CRTAC1 family protein [Polyangiaceae bacterium]
RNRGDGTFDTDEIDTPSVGLGMLFCIGVDYDQDGLTDIALVERRGTVRFLRNLGGLRFAEQDALTDALPSALAVAGFFDYDNDGFPDLLALTYTADDVDYSVGTCGVVTEQSVQCTLDPNKVTPPTAGTLYHNDHGRHFTATSLGPFAPGYANAVDFMDWDGDGWVDAFVSNDFGVNHLLRNEGGAGFTDILPMLRANVPNFGMGVVFNDFDRDGSWDVFVSNGGADELWLGKPDGTLENHVADWGLVPATSFKIGWGTAGADFNNDGWEDLVEANCLTFVGLDALRNNGTAAPEQAHLLFMNRQGKGFAPSLLPIEQRIQIRGEIGIADYDGDGRVDVAIISTALHLYHNDTPTEGLHWLKVLVHEPLATVIVADEQGEIGRGVTANRGPLGTSEQVLHFGLGSRTSVASIDVRWPGGAHKRLTGPIAADGLVEIRKD